MFRNKGHRASYAHPYLFKKGFCLGFVVLKLMKVLLNNLNVISPQWADLENTFFTRSSSHITLFLVFINACTTIFFYFEKVNMNFITNFFLYLNSIQFSCEITAIEMYIE